VEIGNAKSVAEREDEGTPVHIRNEAGELQYENDKPVTITVAGSYSKTYRKATEAQRDKSLKQRRSVPTGEQLSRQALEILASCIVSWEGFTSQGKPFGYSKENAIALLDSAPWIREQCEEALYDHASFFPKAS
jgi:hypothetical protein